MTIEAVVPPTFETEGELKAWVLGFNSWTGLVPKNPFPQSRAPKARKAWFWGWMSASVAAEDEDDV